MAEAKPGTLPPAALMVGARLANMALSLLAIPVLIRYLGGSSFAAWAIYLAMAAGFSLLELGMAQTSVRFIVLARRGDDWTESRRILARVWVLLALSFLAGWLAVLVFAKPLTLWLGLPGSPLLAADETVLWVFGAVAARAFLQSGPSSLLAAHRFTAASVVSLLQPLCSNLAAMAVAWQTSRLDLTLIAFWATQLCVVGAAFMLARRMCVPRFGRDTLDAGRLRELGYYGLTSQMEGWAQFVNFQFGKFIVAGLVGLWAVAAYEVANRAVAALRSIPASAAETFLPTAMSRQASPDDAWQWYQASTRLAAYGVCVFMLAPLAIAPVFLYAWTGEMGYLGRWAFIALSFGAAASVLALPAAILAQAQGWPGLQARAAAVAILLNIPLSLAMVMSWGLVGAALGTAVAMIAGSAQLVRAVHRRAGRSLRSTARTVSGFWMLALVCLFWAGLTYMAFGSWFAALDAGVRFSRVTRIYPGLIAGAIYGLCLVSLLVVAFYRGVMTPQERLVLGRAIRRGRAATGA
jgi:O-antigen/teichoic acid export membrane protein